MARRPASGDIALAAGLAVAGLVETWVVPSSDRTTTEDVLLSIALVLVAGSLAFRRVTPLLAAVGALVPLVAASVLWDDSFAWVIAVVALVAYSAARHATASGSLLILGLLAGYGLALTSVEDNTSAWMYLGNFLFYLVLMVLIPFAAGWALQRRERLGDDGAERAAEAERLRIARELHDVVGHALGVIVVQAEGERASLPPTAAGTRDTLGTIAQTARDALDDVRRLVAVMREDAERLGPQPGLADLPLLLDGLGAIGLPCELTVEGEPRPLPPGVELSAYRAVQEALTNTVRHARAERARVTVTYSDAAVEVAVVDDGRDGSRRGHGGFGLRGMRERVALYGGWVEAGRQPGGGFAVRVHLPTDERATGVHPRARV